MNKETVAQVHAALARKGVTIRELAKKLKQPEDVLLAWLRGAASPPVDINQQIEKVMKIAPGTLSTKLPYRARSVNEPTFTTTKTKPSS